MDKTQPNSREADAQYLQIIKEKDFKELLVSPKLMSARRRKWQKFVNKMYETKGNTLQGLKFGFMVGGLAGLMIGAFTAIQTRRLIAIPISMAVSGATFACIMGLGGLVRSDEGLQFSEQDRQDMLTFARSNRTE